MSAKKRVWDVIWFRFYTKISLQDFKLKGGKRFLSSFPSVHFSVFSILTKLGDKINVLSKMTLFWADFARFRGAFFSVTHYLILVKGKKIIRSVIPSALAIMAEVDFFSFRGISKVINRKKNGHIALHGLYVPLCASGFFRCLGRYGRYPRTYLGVIIRSSWMNTSMTPQTCLATLAVERLLLCHLGRAFRTQLARFLIALHRPARPLCFGQLLAFVFWSGLLVPCSVSALVFNLAPGVRMIHSQLFPSPYSRTEFVPVSTRCAPSIRASSFPLFFSWDFSKPWGTACVSFIVLW